MMGLVLLASKKDLTRSGHRKDIRNALGKILTLQLFKKLRTARDYRGPISEVAERF